MTFLKKMFTLLLAAGMLAGVSGFVACDGGGDKKAEEKTEEGADAKKDDAKKDDAKKDDAKK